MNTNVTKMICLYCISKPPVYISQIQTLSQEYCRKTPSMVRNKLFQLSLQIAVKIISADIDIVHNLNCRYNNRELEQAKFSVSVGNTLSM